MNVSQLFKLTHEHFNSNLNATVSWIWPQHQPRYFLIYDSLGSIFKIAIWKENNAYLIWKWFCVYMNYPHICVINHQEHTFCYIKVTRNNVCTSEFQHFLQLFYKSFLSKCLRLHPFQIKIFVGYSWHKLMVLVSLYWYWISRLIAT